MRRAGASNIRKTYFNIRLPRCGIALSSTFGGRLAQNFADISARDTLIFRDGAACGPRWKLCGTLRNGSRDGRTRSRSRGDAAELLSGARRGPAGIRGSRSGIVRSGSDGDCTPCAFRARVVSD
jgi:hypothetical protein